MVRASRATGSGAHASPTDAIARCTGPFNAAAMNAALATANSVLDMHCAHMRRLYLLPRDREPMRDTRRLNGMQQRRLLATVFVGVVLSVLVSGCGDDSLDQSTSAPPADNSGDSGSVSSPPAVPGQVPPDGSGGSGQAATIKSRTDLTATSPVTPESVTADPTNDRRLLVRFWGGVEPCFGVEVRVVESANDVKVTVLGGVPPEGRDRACIALAKHYQATADLQSPLGSRTIVATK
jgi:hypothetical protein